MAYSEAGWMGADSQDTATVLDERSAVVTMTVMPSSVEWRQVK